MVGDLHFQISRTQMATKMIRNPHFFQSVSHINAQFMVSARFVIDKFFLVFLGRNYLYLTFKSKISAVFLCIYCYYKYTAKHFDENMMYWGFLKGFGISVTDE